MIKIKVLCPGACGIKSGIELVKQGILTSDNVLLLNTTAKDVPFMYKDEAVIFGSVPGCGKERSVGYEEAYADIQENKLTAIDEFITPDTELVIINPSTEGGTGSGSSIIFAQYIKEVFNIPVKIIPFTGFEEDLKGMQNTIEFFKDLDNEYGVEVISNKKFLEEARGNKLKAEQLANQEFVNKVKILSGMTITDAVQNIDKTDLTKVVTTTGYSISGEIVLDKCKSMDQINKSIASALEGSKSLDISEKGYERIAIICSLKESTKDIIDYTFPIFEEYFGVAYETFLHVQDAKDTETIQVIAVGFKMPMDEIMEIYEKFKDKSEALNNSSDEFYNKLNTLDTNMTKRNTAGMVKPRTFKPKEKTEIKERKSSFFFNKDVAKKEHDEQTLEESKKNFMKKNF